MFIHRSRYDCELQPLYLINAYNLTLRHIFDCEHFNYTSLVIIWIVGIIESVRYIVSIRYVQCSTGITVVRFRTNQNGFNVLDNERQIMHQNKTIILRTFVFLRLFYNKCNNHVCCVCCKNVDFSKKLFKIQSKPQ